MEWFHLEDCCSKTFMSENVNTKQIKKTSSQSNLGYFRSACWQKCIKISKILNSQCSMEWFHLEDCCSKTFMSENINTKKIKKTSSQSNLEGSLSACSQKCTYKPKILNSQYWMEWFHLEDCRSNTFMSDNIYTKQIKTTSFRSNLEWFQLVCSWKCTNMSNILNSQYSMEWFHLEDCRSNTFMSENINTKGIKKTSSQSSLECFQWVRYEKCHYRLYRYYNLESLVNVLKSSRDIPERFPPKLLLLKYL
jgi:hypothetical protein